MGFSHKIKPWKLERFVFTVTVLSRRERRLVQELQKGLTLAFLKTEKKGQNLKIVIRLVLERSSRKLSLQLNLNMLQLRGSALWIDMVIIMLRGKESFTCGSAWLTGLQLWRLETAAVCPNYRAPWLRTEASHRESVVSSEKKDGAFVRFWPFLQSQIANCETSRQCCYDEPVSGDLTRCQMADFHFESWLACASVHASSHKSKQWWA